MDRDVGTDPEPLPDWIKHAYDVLTAHIKRRGALDREAAHHVLVTANGFAHDSGDAKFAVRFLLKRGWLYDVDGELRITNIEE